jgi:hypothetical protein
VRTSATPRRSGEGAFDDVLGRAGSSRADPSGCALLLAMWAGLFQTAGCLTTAAFRRMVWVTFGLSQEVLLSVPLWV